MSLKEIRNYVTTKRVLLAICWVVWAAAYFHDLADFLVLSCLAILFVTVYMWVDARM
jgi:hypothetical protein